MFRHDIPAVAYSDPWDAPYHDRLQNLARGDHRIAFYYGHAPDNGTFRYRIYNMAMSLRHLGRGISTSFFYRSELDKLGEVVNNADIIVVCRAKYCDRLGHALTVAKNKGKKVIVDIDDLLFDARYIHLVLKTIDADYAQEHVWQYWYGDCARYEATLALCDSVITTNNYLAERIRDHSGKDVSVVPNFLNEAQLNVSRKIYLKKKESGYSQTKPVYLGYFSGSHTHNLDFGILTEAFIALFEKYKTLKLRIVGLLDLDERLLAYANRIEFQPLQDFINLQRSIGEVEINLIPLQVNMFTNCKSELKYFEAGITGTVSIASPTVVYSNAIRDGDTGFLANSYEWTEKIDGILSAMDHYPELAENAFRHAEENYSWNSLLGLIEKIYLS